MLGWGKKTERAPVVAPPKDGGKGRATPRRTEAQAKNRRPLVPTDRKAAAASSRGQLRAQRVAQRQALITGDEANMPIRDRGPVKRWVRDYVDARRNPGEYVLFAAVFALVLPFIPSAFTYLLSTVVLWGAMAVVAADAYLLSRRLRAGITQKFGADAARGAVGYGVMRSFQFRRGRLPRPQVSRGQRPT